MSEKKISAPADLLRSPVYLCRQCGGRCLERKFPKADNERRQWADHSVDVAQVQSLNYWSRWRVENIQDRVGILSTCMFWWAKAERRYGWCVCRLMSKRWHGSESLDVSREFSRYHKGFLSLHEVVCAQGSMVRGDDQQQEQKRRPRYEMDYRWSKDLHRVRRRSGYRGHRRWTETLGTLGHMSAWSTFFVYIFQSFLSSSQSDMCGFFETS